MRSCYLALLTVIYLSASPGNAADRSVDPIRSRIRRTAVESSALATVGYSKRLHALEIEFRDGLVYRYLHVEPTTFRSLLAADSKALFYNQHIRGKYRCLRVKPKGGDESSAQERKTSDAP